VTDDTKGCDEDEGIGWFDPPEWERVWAERHPDRIVEDVTEAEWLSSTDYPGWMVHPFQRAEDRVLDGKRVPRPRTDRSPSCREWRERKARLLACAAARRVEHLVPDSRGLPFRAVVAAAERHADGGATDDELRAACEQVRQMAHWQEVRRMAHWQQNHHGGPRQVVFLARAATRAAQAVRPRPPRAARFAIMYAMYAAVGTGYYISPGGYNPFSVCSVLYDTVEAAGDEAAAADPRDDHPGPNTGTSRVSAELCDLVRDVFGNPFRPVAFDPCWRTGTAVALARQMYEGRDFALMPILADALQDAGCEHPDILAHYRGPGPHVRGCWVVDLVLGKS
jgi:hypothetical protein